MGAAEKLEREDEREEILAFNKRLLKKGIFVGLKEIPDPIDIEESAESDDSAHANINLEDVESELAVGDGFGVKDKHTPFGWPRADETIDLDFTARPKINTLSMEAETSDEEDNLNTEFKKAVEDKTDFERKTDSLSLGINPSQTEY